MKKLTKIEKFGSVLNLENVGFGDLSSKTKLTLAMVGIAIMLVLLSAGAAIASAPKEPETVQISISSNVIGVAYSSSGISWEASAFSSSLSALPVVTLTESELFSPLFTGTRNVEFEI